MIRTHSNHMKTRREPPISGRIIKENQHGWKIIHIHGTPYERGFAHGFLLYKELARLQYTYPFIVDQRNHTSHEAYIKKSNEIIVPIVKTHFPEIYEELEGIAAGATSRGVAITADFLLAWNSHSSLSSYLKSPKDKCSAFIATGNATKTGEIVMAHTTHDMFPEAQLYNIILFMTPNKGHPFVMQTGPGLVASVTDWFLCSTGIIGCETTIFGTNYNPQFGYPFFCRIRKAMQYATSLKGYADIMKHKNAGDYACSWLFGDIHTNEIMLCEIGLKESNIQTTKNGIYYGMNSAIDYNLRSKETNDTQWNDPSKSTGARAQRMNQLLYDTYYGKISATNAKLILADHYDVFLHKDSPNIRSICKHSENNTESKHKSHYPHGCTDGKVTTSALAKRLSFFARFGSACGRPFSIQKHVRKYPKYKAWEPYTKDFISYPWTQIQSIQTQNRKTQKRKNKT